MAKVSVIIPVYNAEKYLRQCLESVINQTLREIEIICIDDGSTDSSLEILEEYVQKDERIVVLKQENQGAGIARNNGMNVSKGNYIAFCDPDDYYPDNEVLEYLTNKAYETKASIVGGSLIEILPDNRINTQFDIGDGRWFSKDGLVNYLDYQYDYHYQRFLFQKMLLDIHNIEFPRYRRHQDVVFFVKAMIASGSFYSVSRGVYCYRVSNNWSNWNLEKAKDIIDAINELLELVSEHYLYSLYRRIVRRLVVSYKSNLMNFISNQEVRSKLIIILDKIDLDKLNDNLCKKNIKELRNYCKLKKNNMFFLKMYDNLKRITNCYKKNGFMVTLKKIKENIVKEIYKL